MKVPTDKIAGFITGSVVVTILLVSGVAWAAPTDTTVPAPELGEKAATLKTSIGEAQLLGGSFFQPGLVENWTDDTFSLEFSLMQEAALNHVIWQNTVDSKKKQAYYPTTLPGVSSNDLVGSSLQEAKKKGMKVWLGLNSSDDWFKHYANDEKWLAAEVNLDKIIVQELWRQYGQAYGDTIAGFYIPLEVDNIHFCDEKKQKRMALAFEEITAEIHATTAKPVMVAPYFNQAKGQDAGKFADMWGDILTVAPIDIIALQDGLGCNHASINTIGKWFSALAAKIAKVRPETELWSDVETFTPNFLPAPIDRVINQINAERQYVTNFTSFSFNYYDSPNNGQAEQFRQYMEYVDSLR